MYRFTVSLPGQFHLLTDLICIFRFWNITPGLAIFACNPYAIESEVVLVPEILGLTQPLLNVTDGKSGRYVPEAEYTDEIREQMELARKRNRESVQSESLKM